MNVDFELYRIFYIVANNCNITKAAEELMISQPAISKTIKNLEEQLGGKLFIRTKRGVILTEEGKELYKYIGKAMEYIKCAENRFTDLINLDVGCIRIGISTTLTKEFLLPYLKKFHETYPKIDIQISTNLSSELIFKLKNGLLDIVFLNISNNNCDNEIEVTKCKKIKDCFVISKNFTDLLNKEISIKELNNYPLILQSKGSNTRNFLDDFTRNIGVNLKPNIELASYSLVVEFAKIGLGIGYVTKDYIKKDLENNELIELNIKESIPCRYIGFALLKNSLPNFSTKKLIDIITKK